MPTVPLTEEKRCVLNVLTWDSVTGAYSSTSHRAHALESLTSPPSPTSSVRICQVGGIAND
ncbi:unnamed protein product [Protopolystoma xenopodis]|uniref:Uncharacterized protein n=1 Tax=Protopolystoma xenopodis TaxID=117903 RepID=A0A448XM92_9PLAT|nr:unnamed protein product [Protopolystoma xenopodis]